MWLLTQKKQSYNNLENLFDFPYISENRYINTYSADLKELDNELILTIVLPGVLKKDIKLEYKQGYILVDANKLSEPNLDESKQTTYSEVPSLVYQRKFYVGEINHEKISAELSHGILTVTLSKKEEKNAQLIDIG